MADNSLRAALRAWGVRNAGLLAVAWAAAVLVLTLMPGNDVPSWPWAARVHLDKFVHAFLFGVQCVLLSLAFVAIKPWRLPVGPLVAALLSAIAFGGLIELLQQAMGAGRHGDVLDLLADAAGALAGALLGYWALRRWSLTRSSPRPPSR